MATTVIQIPDWLGQLWLSVGFIATFIGLVELAAWIACRVLGPGKGRHARS